MPSKRREDTTLGGLYPRLQYAALPDAILALEHVLSYIDELLMTPEEAAVCAARGGQVERLQSLLQRICYRPVWLADDFLEVTAEYGNCDVINVVYDYWDRRFPLMSAAGWTALEVAIHHGHINAVNACCLDSTGN